MCLMAVIKGLNYKISVLVDLATPVVTGSNSECSLILGGAKPIIVVLIKKSSNN